MSRPELTQSSEEISVPDWFPLESLDELNTKQRRIIAFLANEIEQEEDSEDGVYTRSKRIAEQLGLSSREVGTNLHIARSKVDAITVEKWARSNSTTWVISREC